MAGRTDGLIKTFRAGAAIPPYRLVKFGVADDTVLPAAAAGDDAIGASIELPTAQGERVDVALSDIADVRFGGNVARGKPVTSDAQGRAVQAAPAPGVTVRIAGFAMVAGTLDDIAPVHLAPGFMTG